MFLEMCEATPGLKDKVWDFINQLPQTINKQDAENWLDATASLPVEGVNVRPEREMEQKVKQLWWHLRRLSGIGGSEINDAVSFVLGRNSYFNDPQGIFDAKRMKVPPQGWDNYTRRGTLFENAISEIYMSDYGLTRDRDILKKMKEASGSIKDYEFIVGSPDDVLKDEEGNIYLVDYKTASVIPSTPPDSYISQLHYYDLLDSDGNPEKTRFIKIDAYFDFANGIVVPHEVEHNSKLSKELMQKGKHLWELICDPEITVLPEVWTTPPSQGACPLSDDDKKFIPDIEERAMRISALEKSVKQEKEDLLHLSTASLSNGGKMKDGLKDNLETCQVRGSFDVKDPAEVDRILTARQENPEDFKQPTSYWDAEKLSNFLLSKGVEPKDFKKKAYNPDALDNYFRANGIDVNSIFKSKVTVFPSQKRVTKEIMASYIEETMAFSEEFIHGCNEEELGDFYDDSAASLR